ncbi:uncharacterized protein LOC107846305 [Capsicum annuum]|uniref:uncharacterized protein LOC107846305 n=1 Tax=Capsicum annuum TaxID=4072 RepID=UPI001FB13D5A|nr:uncharacterized protein LOC107846305 [Capsicum annuum]
MAAKIDFIKEVSGTKMHWYFKVRVMRFWIIPDREKEDNIISMEMVLQDERISTLLIGVRRDNSMRISQISTQRTYSVSKELSSGDIEAKTIAQLIQCLHEGNFWIYATILHVEVENRWSYMACKKCTRKIDKLGNKFHCKKCDRLDHSATYRYKLQVRVMDGTDFISLLLWDREATKLIGKTATQLKGHVDEVAVKTDNVEQHNEVYTVIKICDDEEVTKQFCPSHSDDYSPDPDINCEKIADEPLEITMILDSNPHNDLITPTNTPAKRSLLEVESLGIEVDDDPNSQLSSTKAYRAFADKDLSFDIYNKKAKAVSGPLLSASIEDVTHSDAALKRVFE